MIKRLSILIAILSAVNLSYTMEAEPTVRLIHGYLGTATAIILPGDEAKLKREKDQEKIDVIKTRALNLINNQVSPDNRQLQKVFLQTAQYPELATIFNQLLEYGVKPTEKIEDFYEAILENNINGVKLLLKFGIDPNSVLEGSEESPLMVAIYMNHPEIVKELLSHGADVNYQSSKMGTLL